MGTEQRTSTASDFQITGDGLRPTLKLKHTAMILIETNRIERVALLATLFLSERALTTTDAAARTGVSVRTIQRDFAAISRVIPIYSDGGRWVYAPQDGAKISLY